MPVNITIDYNRCTDALGCARCMRACPTMVFNAKSPKPEKYTESDRTTFRLEPTYHPSCIVCMGCVEVCPVDAIRISVNGQPITVSNVKELWPQGHPAILTPTKKAPMGQLRPDNHRMKLEDSGKPRDYDVPKAMIQDACATLNLVERAKLAAQDEASREAFTRLGAEAMALTVELGDGTYLDRTGEMVNIVAAQTGINLPHRVQRYAELSLISLRPQDRYNVSVATIKQLSLQVFTCGIAEGITEALGREAPCEELCLSCFRVAARKVDPEINVTIAQKMPQGRSCEFVFVK